MSRFAPTFDAVCDFQNLHAAHIRARAGKRDRFETIEFELHLGSNLTQLSDELAAGVYKMLPYVRFVVDDPKRRVIHALHYRDRVVQHSLCDNVIMPILEPRLVFDNAACRKGKGALFALRRMERFMREHYRTCGTTGWFVKCDIFHFFDEIHQDRLLEQLAKCPFDNKTMTLLEQIVRSYRSDSLSCGERGLPLGNQSSQWMALYFLDSMDRLVKERLRVRAYSRYMDDAVLLLPTRAEARLCLESMEDCVHALGLKFNSKTQISPLSHGITYLGWHFSLSKTGRVTRVVRSATRKRIKRRLVYAKALYSHGVISAAQYDSVVKSISAYLKMR